MTAGEARADVAPAEAPAGTASVPLMITRRQRAALRVMGVTEDAIGLMTPAEAHALLRGEPSSLPRL